MTYTAHDPRTFYDTIETRLASQTGKRIGRVEAPNERTLPYAVIRPLAEALDVEMGGTLADPHATTVFEWQVISVGEAAAQAEWMQHKVRTALLGWRPAITGWSFGLVEMSGGQGTRRDDGTQPALFYTIDEFTVFVGEV